MAWHMQRLLTGAGKVCDLSGESKEGTYMKLTIGRKLYLGVAFMMFLVMSMGAMLLWYQMTVVDALVKGF